MRANVLIGLLSAALLGGCMETTTETPSTATSTGGVDPLTGISRSALAAVVGMGNQVSVFYYPDKISAAEKAAAPALACKKRGGSVEEVKDKLPEHPEELPGVRHLVIYCK